MGRTNQRETTDGDQVVTIDCHLGYAWKGGDLVKGDKVVLPGNWHTDNKPWIGTVTKIGHSWSGEFIHVLRRATEEDLSRRDRSEHLVE